METKNALQALIAQGGMTAGYDNWGYSCKIRDMDKERMAKIIGVMMEALEKISGCLEPQNDSQFNEEIPDYIFAPLSTYEAEVAKKALQQCQKIAEGE